MCLFLSNHNANSGTGILQENDNFSPYIYPSQNFHADEQNLSLGHDIVVPLQLIAMPESHTTGLIDQGNAFGSEFVADAIAFCKILPFPRIGTLLNQVLNLSFA